MRYPVVLFDVGETLVGPRGSFGSTYATVVAGLGLSLPAADLENAFRDTWSELSRSIPAGSDRYRHFADGERGYWLRVVRGSIERAAGAPLSEREAGAALDALRAAFARRDAWLVYDDVFPALDALRSAGVRLGVVSNWDSRLPHVLHLLGLAHYFEAVIFSQQEGVEKPDPELFRRALARLGAKPGQVLHVGDVPELDQQGARAAGIDSVLVDRRGAFGPRADVIADLRETLPLAHGGLPA